MFFEGVFVLIQLISVGFNMNNKSKKYNRKMKIEISLWLEESAHENSVVLKKVASNMSDLKQDHDTPAEGHYYEFKNKSVWVAVMDKHKCRRKNLDKVFENLLKCFF
jgi:hypothetical protein